LQLPEALAERAAFDRVHCLGERVRSTHASPNPRATRAGSGAFADIYHWELNANSGKPILAAFDQFVGPSISMFAWSFFVGPSARQRDPNELKARIARIPLKERLRSCPERTRNSMVGVKPYALFLQYRYGYGSDDCRNACFRANRRR
jgi:hypothetical protein